MTKSKTSESKQLVIDACIAFSTGKLAADSPESVKCRSLLLLIKEICHRIVMSAVMLDEWKRNGSPFAQRWLIEMNNLKKVCMIDNPSNRDFRKSIGNMKCSKKEKDVMKKDMHLIEMALKKDKIIISLDEKSKRLFVKLSLTFPRMLDLVWMNPLSHSIHDVESWLLDGAPSREEWTFKTMSRL